MVEKKPVYKFDIQPTLTSKDIHVLNLNYNSRDEYLMDHKASTNSSEFIRGVVLFKTGGSELYNRLVNLLQQFIQQLQHNLM